MPLVPLLLLLLATPSALSSAGQLSIGTLHAAGSHQWHNLKHAIDEWNGGHAPVSGFSLGLVSPSDATASVDIRFCEIAQYHLVAVFVPFGESTGTSESEFRVALAMCKRMRIPCLVDRLSSAMEVNPFVSSLGPPSGVLSRALSHLTTRMMWSSFLLLYKHPNELTDLLPLLAMWRSNTGTRVSFRMLQLPSESSAERYGLFLKHVLKQLRHTNIIVHTEDLGTVHSLLAQATRLNMTESRYSYLVANLDLHLLEDFLGPEFHCNITGFQIVRDHPLIKLDLALAIDAVSAIGAAIRTLKQRHLEPQTQQLLCDAGDQWADGMLVQERIRRTELGAGSTGRTVRFNGTSGERRDIALVGITRLPNGTFTEIGQWDDSKRSWISDQNYDEKNKWRFRIGPRGVPDLRGEKLKVVVYLEEPFVMRRRPGQTTDGQKVPSHQQKQRGWPNEERRELGEEEYEGFCIDLLKEMAKLLNFTYEIEEVDDGTYGVEDENGRWNGIIGVLQRHEADLSVSAVTITYSRVSVVDFTLPFMHLGIAILMRRSMGDESERGASTSSNLFTFMEPLAFSVWLALAVAYVSVASTMWLLAKCSPYEWYDDVRKVDERRRRWRRDGSRRFEHKDSSQRPILEMFLKKNQFSLLNSLWFAVGSLMQQGSDVIPRAAATRTVAVIWWDGHLELVTWEGRRWLFTLILISSYTAQLAAFLTVERMSTPVESSADLAAQQRIKFGTLSNGSTMEFFRESRIPIYERMWSIMQSTTPTVFVNSSREGIARVKTGNYAYMMESTMLEYWIGEDCQLQTIGGLLDSKGYGVALPKGSPLRDIFSRAVLQLQERTILEALKNKWWKSQPRQRTEFSYGSSASSSGPAPSPNANNCPPPNGHSHSSLHRVFGIFYVLFAAIIVALLLAIGEFCVESRRRHSLRLGLCLPGRIINWIHWLKEAREEEQLESRSTRLKGSDLYLDTVERVETPNGPGPKGSSSSRDDSSLAGRPQSSLTSIAAARSPSLDEADEFVGALQQQHSNCMLAPTHCLAQRQVSMPDDLAGDASGANLMVPGHRRLRKISEPGPPQRMRRKQSIRDVFSKLSTPSIVIGAEPEDFKALQHLIPLTDERLLTRRHSSQPPSPPPKSPAPEQQ